MLRVRFSHYISETDALKDVIGEFNRELENQKQDLEATRKEMKRLSDAMLEAVEAGSDTDSMNKEHMRQMTIAAEHIKNIKKLDTNERLKMSIKYCLQRRTYVIQIFDEEAGHVCNNVGLVDATERLQELERFLLSVDMSPAVFREDMWDIKEVNEGISIRNIGNELTTLWFNPIITSDVFTFAAMLTGVAENGEGLVYLGCVSKLEADSKFKTKFPYQIACRHHVSTTTRTHGSPCYFEPDNKVVSLGPDALLAIGDVLECTADMEQQKISFKKNGVHLHESTMKNMTEGVYPVLYSQKNTTCIFFGKHSNST